MNKERLMLAGRLDILIRGIFVNRAGLGRRRKTGQSALKKNGAERFVRAKGARKAL
jgi:hypothetical protein